ncbi:hypothetical protein MASR1M90_16480 [Desulfovibrionales bacterium]
MIQIDGLFIHTVQREDFLVRCSVLHGDRRTVIWDTLTRPQDMAPVLRACSSQAPLVVYSHADWDHVGGTAVFAPDTLVMAHRSCLARFQDDVPQTLRALRTNEPGLWDDVRLIEPNVLFDTRLDLDLGGVTLELHHLPGHTADAIVGFVPQWGLLLAGDAVELPCPCVPHEPDLVSWISGLTQWLHHPGLRRVLPSHGPSGGSEVVAQTIAYLQGLLHGRPVPMPADLPTFYSQTHLDNMQACGLKIVCSA